MNLYDLSVSILGILPSEFNFLYGLLTFLLAIITILIIISPFVLVIKLLGGK